MILSSAKLMICLCGVSLMSGEAREFEVRQLKGDPKNGIWGTKEFSMHVSALGVIRYVKVNGRELVWQAAALYTRPVAPDGRKGLRTVQGEGFGKRGLTVEAPLHRTESKDGYPAWGLASICHLGTQPGVWNLSIRRPIRGIERLMRDLLICLVWKLDSFPLAEIGEKFQVGYTSVSNARSR